MKIDIDLTSGSIARALIKITIPIVAGRFLQTGYNLIDTLFVSRIGATEVGAVTFVMPIVMVIISLANGLATAGISLISQSIGRGNRKQASDFMGQIFAAGFILSLIIAVTGYLWAGKLMASLQLPDSLLLASEVYVAVIFLSTPFTFFNVIYDSIRNSEGQAWKSLTILGISLILNIFFNYLFIFIFHWGIRGAAWATLIARGLGAAYSLADLIYCKHGLTLKRQNMQFKLPDMKIIVKLGFPGAIARGMTSFGFVIINIFVVKYGTDVLAAFGIGSRINSIFFMPSVGFGLALAAIAGQNLGAGYVERAKKSVSLTMTYSLIFSGLSAIILFTFRYQFSRLFSSDPTLIQHTVNFLEVVAVTIIPWGVFQVMTGLFQGAGYAKTAMMISLIRLWVLRIPLLILLGWLTPWGEYAIWYSMFISNTVTAVASIALYYIIPWHRGLKKELD